MAIITIPASTAINTPTPSLGRGGGVFSRTIAITPMKDISPISSIAQNTHKTACKIIRPAA
jgi:hypothetical protein